MKTSDARQTRPRGQILVIFAGAIFMLMMLTALVVDVSWYWVNSLRIQRAADAAALAGAVLLPTDRPNAYDRARKEATKNGYTALVVNGIPNGVTVTPVTADATPRRLSVTITAPVGTFFMRVAGITSLTASRVGRAEFVLPVPMGSPQNYYGVGFLRDGVTTTSTSTSTTTQDRDTGGRIAALATPLSTSSGWRSSLTNGNGNPSNTQMVGAIDDDDNDYAYTNVRNQQQQWGNFGFTFPLTNGGGVTETMLGIRGIEVDLDDVRINSSSSSCNNTRVRVELSWNGGSSWSNDDETSNLSTNQTVQHLGDDNSLSPWTGHTWVQGDFTNANFRVRWTAIKNSNCSAEIRVDEMLVTVHYQVRRVATTTTTTTTIQDVPVVSPFGDVLAPQNFWAGLQSQGAPNVQGDAYMTKYDSRSGGGAANKLDGTDPDAVYDPDKYYSYAIEMPPNSSGGQVWIFDPGFCDTSPEAGTGEYWTIGGSNGYSSPRPVSAFYTLQDAGADLYSTADDGNVYSVSSGNTFRAMSYTDEPLIDQLIATNQLNNQYDNDRASAGNCADLSWHYDVNQWNAPGATTPRRGWYLLGSGLTGGPQGTVYRLHTYSTDFASPNDQNNTTALNAFAIYANAGGSVKPKVYGLGAMEAYVRLPSSKVSEFYLAQIDKVHAGKTMEISLWDPGDTGALSASLQILAPGATTYSPVNFTWTATRGTTDSTAASCTGSNGSGSGNSIQTNSGSGNGARFNGCWLTISIPINQNYSAPHPSGDNVTTEGGWWKIRYTMGSGNSGDYATDLTTWQVSIRGNPVHLVTP